MGMRDGGGGQWGSGGGGGGGEVVNDRGGCTSQMNQLEISAETSVTSSSCPRAIQYLSVRGSV